VDGNVTLAPGGCRQHIENRHGAPRLWQIDPRPRSFSPPELHVYFLHLAARKLLFYVEIQAHQTEYNAYRLALVVRSLHAEGIHHVLAG
jgi:hypothetical protein